MKISRDQASKNWLLSSGTQVLYQGRKSPWDDPSIIRDAQRREADARERGRLGPRREAPTSS